MSYGKTPRPVNFLAAGSPKSERQQMALVRQLSTPSPDSDSYQSGQKNRKDLKINERGETALHLAAIRGDTQTVVRLLTQNADPNVQDYAGWTPLHEACNRGWYDIAYKLVEAGANINAKGLENFTPLHDCVLNGHLGIVKLLVQYGADIFARNFHGKSPLDCASDVILPYLLNGAPSNQELLNRAKDNDIVNCASSGEGMESSSDVLSEDQSADDKPEPVPESEPETGTQKRPITDVQSPQTDDTDENDENRRKKRKDNNDNNGTANNNNRGGVLGTTTKTTNNGSGVKQPQKDLGSTPPPVGDSTEPVVPSPPPPPVPASEPDEKSDLKVPPLKIVIPPQQNEVESGTNRNGKSTFQRNHSLPYVVSSTTTSTDEVQSSAIEGGTPIDSTPKTVTIDSTVDKKETVPDTNNQRILRSSHRAIQQQAAPPTATESDQSGGVVSPGGGVVVATPTSPSTQPTQITTNADANDTIVAPSVDAIGNSDVVTSTPPVLSPLSQPEPNSTDPKPINDTSDVPVPTTTTESGTVVTPAPTISTVTPTTNPTAIVTAAPVASNINVDLHPRKRKMKPTKEVPPTISGGGGVTSSATPTDGGDVAAGEAQIHPHDQPITNCYQLFLNIRKQIEKRRRGLFPVQPKPPQGFKDYLMNRCTYVLATNAPTTPTIIFPATLPPPMKDLFTEQEKERYRLRMQHVIEKEKLVLSVEQEILRVHGRAARALANQSLPFSACTILRDEEVYNLITPEQEEKDRNARSRYNGRLFLSWLQDVDDKWEKIKEHMLLRHHNEAESLYAVQKMHWEWKLKEINLCDRKTTPTIEEQYVPMVHVSDDFDLLPA